MEMSNRLKPLSTLPFVICLLTLMVNDFYLKEVYHNTLTGKLSDFCGLFIFPIFWSALLPRYKRAIFFLTAFLFIYWKSDHASPFIDLFSTYLWSINRVADSTDLTALIVLPMSWYSSNHRIQILKFDVFTQRTYRYAIAGVSFFAFCATSAPRYAQTFDQPQYVLFNSKVLLDSNDYNNEFTFYHFDSLLVIEVNQMMTSKQPAKADDYNKNLSVKELDKDVLRQLPSIQGEMSPGKITCLTVKTAAYQDSLRFNGARLEGKFIRRSGTRIIIEGFYKNGIEDSVWTYRDTAGTNVIKKIFINGEELKFRNLRLTS